MRSGFVHQLSTKATVPGARLIFFALWGPW